MADATFHVFRGDKNGGELKEYTVPVGEGQVVLDAMPWIHGDRRLVTKSTENPMTSPIWSCIRKATTRSLRAGSHSRLVFVCSIISLSTGGGAAVAGRSRRGWGACGRCAEDDPSTSS